MVFVALPEPNVPSRAVSVNGVFSSSGALPPGGHFAIGNGVQPNLANFGGFVNIPNVPGANMTSFQLYVDNVLIASKSVSFTVY
jgi:hypothetical protein